MKATILDTRTEGEGRCYLCKLSLEDYVNGLDDTYQEYEIQREIVTNVYLDALVFTVLGRQHIPPIVLVVDSEQCAVEGNKLSIGGFKIIDGLQRTFRLQAIHKTIKYCYENLTLDTDYLSWSKFQFSRKFSSELRKLDSNTDVLRAVTKVFKDKGKSGLIEAFEENYQWFEIWTGLTTDDEVRKMLTLNAGHKPVKARHQLELLFLNILPVLKNEVGQGFTLIREKEMSSTQASKQRQRGHFQFAHIITALLSLYEAKPIATSTNLIQGIQSSEDGIEKYADFITSEFLKLAISFLMHLERLLESQYGEIGISWMGREVVLAGLFGAIGAVSVITNASRSDVMTKLIDVIKDHAQILALDDFEKSRNSVDLSKVNIGNINRSAIFWAVKEILTVQQPCKIDWISHFRKESK